ncbi:MAG TPA: molybdopterin-dependent oxidoreductase [Candidatus Dormibacteraeota bacterium]|jgi:DMSO/TMAO reductase YedYZ molybdopterin-dependent catalytic subunit|nr:molybdopterin-dependent oxidoreductase [Candidatus Dormibacteraeota bacterium]
MKKIVFALFLFFACGIGSGLAQNAPAVASRAELRVGGEVTTPLVLTADDLKKMPRKTLSVVNPHSQKKETYEGVPIEEVLRKAGAPGGEHLRGAAMAIYVVAEASDNYRVVFSLAELDPGILDSEIIVADTLDGAPLSEKEGPFKLVAPHEKRPARWIRMLKSLTVVRAQ